MWENWQQWKLQFITLLLSQTPVSPSLAGPVQKPQLHKSDAEATQQRLNSKTPRCRRSYLNQVFSGEKRQADMFHQVSQVFLPDVFVVVDPSYHSLKNLQNEVHRHFKSHLIQSFVHVALPDIASRVCVCLCVCLCVLVCIYLLLCGDGELVAGDQAGYLLHAQIEELLTPDHLSEMLLCRDKKNYFVTQHFH